MDEFAGFFKALSDKKRIKIIWLLIKAETELCVCEIMDVLKESQYNVSRYLKALKRAGLVRERKEGRWVLYSLIPPLNKFQELLLQAVASIPEEIFLKESKRLEKCLSLRKNGRCVTGIESKDWQKIVEELEKEGG